jgi:hypothetical protein
MAYDTAKGRVYIAAAQYGPPPAPTAANPHPRAAPLPDSFQIIVVEK